MRHGGLSGFYELAAAHALVDLQGKTRLKNARALVGCTEH
jgi:hypothetical protein